jgi:hypothetical protein
LDADHRQPVRARHRQAVGLTDDDRVGLIDGAVGAGHREARRVVVVDAVGAREHEALRAAVDDDARAHGKTSEHEHEHERDETCGFGRGLSHHHSLPDGRGGQCGL